MRSQVILAIVSINFICISCNLDCSKDNTSSPKESTISTKHRQDSLFFATETAIRNGDTLNLASFYRKLLSTDTTNINFYLYYSGVLCLNGMPEKAIIYLEKAQTLGLNLSSVYYGKGLAWSFLNRDSMYYYHDKAILTDSLNVYYLTFRSKLYEEDTLYEKALCDINRAILLQPNNKDLYAFRGVYLKQLKRYNEALTDLKNTPSSREKDFKFYLIRAEVYVNLNEPAKAISDCNRSIEINPNFAYSYTVRGTAKSNLKDFEGAYDDFKKAVELGDIEAIPVYKKFKEHFEHNKSI